MLQVKSDAQSGPSFEAEEENGGAFLCFGGIRECIKLRVVLVRACRANRPPRCNNNLDSCSVCLRWGNGGGGRSCELQRKRLNS